jgi:hypothetical protein
MIKIVVNERESSISPATTIMVNQKLGIDSGDSLLMPFIYIVIAGIIRGTETNVSRKNTTPTTLKAVLRT